jgi:MFS family permease
LIREPCDDGVIRSANGAAPCPKSSRNWVLAATILGSSLAFIDGTAVNVALPALQRNLQATVGGVQWVIESYLLLLAALLLVGGSLGDRVCAGAEELSRNWRRRTYLTHRGFAAAFVCWDLS